MDREEINQGAKKASRKTVEQLHNKQMNGVSNLLLYK